MANQFVISGVNIKGSMATMGAAGVTYISKTDWSGGLSPFTASCGDVKLVSVSTVSRASNIVTVTTGAAHGFNNGETATLYGVTDNSFNVSGTVANASGSTYTFSQNGANASSSLGTAVVNANDCVTDSVATCAVDSTVGYDDSSSVKCPVSVYNLTTAGRAQNPQELKCLTGSTCGGGSPYNPPVTAGALWLRYYIKIDQKFLDCMANQGGGSPVNLIQEKFGLSRRTSGGAGFIQPIDQQSPASNSFSMVADDSFQFTDDIFRFAINTWYGLKFKMTRTVGGNGCLSVWTDTQNNSAAPRWDEVTNFTAASPYCASTIGWDGTTSTDAIEIRIGAAVPQTIAGCVSSNGTMNTWVDKVFLGDHDPSSSE